MLLYGRGKTSAHEMCWNWRGGLKQMDECIKNKENK